MRAGRYVAVRPPAMTVSQSEVVKTFSVGQLEEVPIVVSTEVKFPSCACSTFPLALRFLLSIYFLLALIF
jgi:hypothetical protein